MEFSRQEYWSGLPVPSPGHLLNPGIEPRSPALQADSLPAEPLLLLLSHLSHVRLCATRGQQPTRLLCPHNSLGKSTGVGCHFLLQAEPQGDLIKSLISELNIRMSSGAWDSVLFLQEALVQNLDASCLFCLYFVRNMTAQKLREPNLRELVLSSQDHPILTQKKPDL